MAADAEPARCRSGGGKAARPRCRHCGCRVASRPRRLCRHCHDDPAIRQQYAPRRPCGRRGTGTDSPGGIPRPLPRHGTAAEPGSEDKIAILQQRARQGQQLHHPADRRLPHPLPDILRDFFG
jgi:hypothetical protein